MITYTAMLRSPHTLTRTLGRTRTRSIACPSPRIWCHQRLCSPVRMRTALVAVVSPVSAVWRPPSLTAMMIPMMMTMQADGLFAGVGVVTAI